jgi:TonB-linked SusC/RagA family outer membrane protein
MYKINYIKRIALLRCIHKILFLMRLTTVIILLTMFQLSAAITFGQRLTYNKKNTTINQLFKEIKTQTGYNVVWYEGKLNSQMVIDANFYNTPLEKVMDNVLAGRAVTYEIIGKAIVIKIAEPSFRDKIISFFATIDVRGRVLDENDEPLVGAVVKVKGGSVSTATNSNGEFILKNIDENAVLKISFLGYEQQEIKVAEKMGDIKLTPSEDKLEEVEINAGYYTVKERERTGSISRIDSKVIERQPVNNVLQAMQANIPGVQITQNTGVPGGSFTVQIRGKNSISQGSEPYYIIDGVPFNAIGLSQGAGGITPNPNPLSSINPLDIESIEVLKDADATAIYGSRGANGVVLITTKRGQSGKAKASFAINQGISRVGKKMELMNTQEYITMRKEALANDKLPVSATDYDLNGTWEETRYTDWQKELIGKSAPMTNIQLSLSGGTNNLTYLIGGNYYKENTVFPGESSYKRSSGNFSLQYQSDNKKLATSFDANYSQINSNIFLSDITQYITLAPNYPSLLNEMGGINWANNTMYLNPMAMIQQPFDSTTGNLIANGLVSYTIIPNLKLKANMGVTLSNRKEFDSTPLVTFSPVLNLGTTSRVSNFGDNISKDQTFEGQGEYSKSINQGKISFLIGTSFQQGIRDLQKVTGSGYNSDALMENIAAASVFRAATQYSKYRYTAMYGRLNYSFKDKYFINITGRRDGSSRFGVENQFANFGAIGAAWIFSDEQFVNQNLTFISFAKLRGSYGITGNDQITDYGYLELWRSPNTYQGIATMAPANIANPNYAWEVNKKAEIALDLSFFKNRISLSSGYYSNRSSNQLVLKPLAPSTGFTSLQDNISALISNTGWEFQLDTKNLSKKQFIWSSSLNLTIPKNELISYPGLAISGNANSLVIGQPLSIKKLYNTYVDSQSGLYAIEDYDKNGIIDSKDQYKIEFLGRKFYGGIGNSLSYKGITLDFLFQYVKQTATGFYLGFRTAGSFTPSLPYGNQLTTTNDRWKAAGEYAMYQKYSSTSSASTAQDNAAFSGSLAVYDASFLRLKNLSLSYNFPSSLAQRIHLNSAKLFLFGQNLFTISKYKGLDPEIPNNSRLPMLQVLTVGIQLTL